VYIKVCEVAFGCLSEDIKLLEHVNVHHAVSMRSYTQEITILTKLGELTETTSTSSNSLEEMHIEGMVYMLM
jgi:hypothetical protein